MSAPLPLLPMITLVFTLLVAAAGCGAPDPEAGEISSDQEAGGLSSDPDADTLPPDPLDPEQAMVADSLGAPAAGALAQGLVGRLGEALEDRGVDGAMEFCAVEAIPLTVALSEEHAPDFELKRTSLRVRNPDNAPDEWEERMLRYIEAMEAREQGSAPETMTAAGPDGSLRFYRTLRTAPMCLQCHGAEDDLAPDVREVLEARYPDDRATGYEAGDVRGLLRVQIPAGR